MAGEIRDIIDTIRESESARVLTILIPILLDLLRGGEPAFRKDSLEYQFRRSMVETLNRIPLTEPIRFQGPAIFACLLHVLRHDNEENGITCCKTIIELAKSWRCITEATLAEFLAIVLENLANMKTFVPEVLSEDCTVLEVNIAPRSVYSFRVLSEMSLAMVFLANLNRALYAPSMQSTIAPVFEFVSLEAPAQKAAREDAEAMENVWVGMALTIKNPAVYADFVCAQIKVRHIYDCPTLAYFVTDAIVSCLGDATESKCGTTRPPRRTSGADRSANTARLSRK